MTRWTVAQNERTFGEEYDRALSACLRRGWITEGPETAKFLTSLRDIIGTPHVSIAPNGTLALYLALAALDIGPGDEVIVPDLTFIASATAVLMTGATPVFVDVLPNGLLDPAAVHRAIGPTTRAIMPVHLFGFLAPSPIPREVPIPIVEDACQAFGVLPPAQFTAPRIQAFSFFADKAFTTGEGGAVATTNEELATRMLYLRNQGRIDRGSFSHPEIGVNLRMTDLQCALGNVQLSRFHQVAMDRRRVWYTYRVGMGHISNACACHLLAPPEGQEEAFIPFRVVVVFDEPLAHDVAEAMRRRGAVEPREMFVPLHRQPCFSMSSRIRLDSSNGIGSGYPNATHLWQHALLLPCWPAMTDAHVRLVLHELSMSYLEAKGS